MVSAYKSEVFARAYDMRCTGFAKRLAPAICDFYTSTLVGKQNRSMLDLCCGTGRLCLYFLTNGFRVLGIDLSEPMLKVAMENAREYVQLGQAKFVQASASDFALEETFGLVVSTFDSLNHLEDEMALERCFRCVRMVNCGYFIFDLNTRKGLRIANNMLVDDSNEDVLLINRGVYDESFGRAWTRFTGFVRVSTGLYERFEETAFNTVFEMERVRDMLLAAGWTKVVFAEVSDLGKVLSVGEAENEGRVLVVATA